MAGTHPSHFFKLIRPSTIQAKKLGIPNMFVKKFGDELSNSATLTVPNGRVWKVGLTKDGRKIWFHGGWHEFAEHHSISAGYFLVFRYGNNSNFHVLIFNMSACEIQYPVYCFRLEDDSNQEDSVEIIGSSALETNSCRKATAAASLKSPLFMPSHRGSYEEEEEAPPLRRSKRCKIEKGMVDDNNQEDSVEIIGSSALETNSCRKATAAASLKSPLFMPSHRGIYEEAPPPLQRSKRCKIEEGMVDERKLKSEIANEHEFVTILEEMGISVNRNFRYIAAEERARAIAAARLFRPKNPSFMVIFRSWNLQKGSMYVPSQFGKKHFINRAAEFITLQDRDGREWSSKVRIPPGRGGGDLSHGWTVFSKEKNLKNGDICIFELMKEKNIVLKVSVFHSSSSSSTTTIL